MIGSQFLRFVLLYHSSLQTNQRIHPVLYKELSWDSGMSIFNQTHLAQMAWTGSWHQSFSKAASACRLKRASGTVHPLHPGSTTYEENVRTSVIIASQAGTYLNIDLEWRKGRVRNSGLLPRIRESTDDATHNEFDAYFLILRYLRGQLVPEHLVQWVALPERIRGSTSS